MPAVVNAPVRVIEVAEDAYQVIASQEPVQVVTVGIAGPQGPQGPQGLPGPGGGATFIFSQNTPATTWNINHNLESFPSVTVVDSGNTVVIGDVAYIDNNNVTLNFVAPFGGRAFLN